MPRGMARMDRKYSAPVGGRQAGGGATKTIPESKPEKSYDRRLHPGALKTGVSGSKTGVSGSSHVFRVRSSRDGRIVLRRLSSPRCLSSP